LLGGFTENIIPKLLKQFETTVCFTKAIFLSYCSLGQFLLKIRVKPGKYGIS